MLKIVLGVIAGFVAWTIIWVGSDQVLMLVSPKWYGAHQLEFERALVNQEPFAPFPSILLLSLLRAAVISILSGYLAAFVAGENRKSPLALGILLLAVGIAIQSSIWNYLPIWYHLVFLILLVPATIFGGRLKSAR